MPSRASAVATLKPSLRNCWESLTLLRKSYTKRSVDERPKVTESGSRECAGEGASPDEPREQASTKVGFVGRLRLFRTWLFDRRWRFAAALALLVLVVALGVLVWRFIRPRHVDTLVLATGTLGAAYDPAGRAIAEAISPGLAFEGQSRLAIWGARRSPASVQAKRTEGGSSNLRMLERGTAQLALLHSNVSVPLSVRAVARLYDEPLQIVAWGDHPMVIDELCDRRLAIGARDSNSNEYARKVLEHFCPARSGRTLMELSYAAGKQAFARHEADAFFIMTGLPVAIVQELLALEGTSLVSLGDPSHAGSEVEGFRVRHPEVRTAVLAERIYGREPTRPVGTIASSAVLAARADLDANLVTDIARGLFEQLPAMARAEPLLANLDRRGEPLPIPWHEGAKRFYGHEASDLSFHGFIELLSVMGTIASAMSLRSFVRRDTLTGYYRRVTQVRAAASASPRRERHDKLRALLREVLDEVGAGKLDATHRLRVFVEDLREEIRELREEIREEWRDD